ncbi:MAG: hypothetical protein HPY69_07820 [Armatimonadetes bacterium]|nr:hypothetical protein [Armatimonadota bacterium]
MDMARKVHAIVRREAPRAQFNANPWAVTQWEDLHMNCFRGRFWAREATNTRVVLWEPEPLGPSCGIELSMHKYCRSLALNSLLQERMPIELSPDARDVQRLRRRGVSRVWAWPYFPLDEVDNGDLREGFRVPQSETRYIRRFVDQPRKIGLNGIIGNGGFAEDQCVELVNLYCLPRFCRDEQATPERVLDELAGHLATRQTQKDLAQVLRFSENNSTWGASLPEQCRLPPLATQIQTAAEALGILDRVVPRDEPSLALPEPPAAYLARLKDRLRGVVGPV